MKKFALLSVILLAACTPIVTDEQAAHQDDGSSSAMMTTDRLNHSPRHQEWVAVKNGDKTIHTWVVYPERSDNAPVVMLIHENRGLSDWVRAMADQVAEAGYIAVAPDLLSGFSAEYDQTSDFPDEDAARTAIGELDLDQTMSDLNAVAQWAQKIPAGNGTLVSAGFCWGGSRSFQFATLNDDLDAAFVFYGTGPTDAADYAGIEAPVFGFYGGADQRVNATIAASQEAMQSAGKTYDYEIYDAAGHAFMRLGEDPDADQANRVARDAAWERMKNILGSL